MKRGSIRKESWPALLVGLYIFSLSSPSFAQEQPRSGPRQERAEERAAQDEEPPVGFDEGFYLRSKDGNFLLRAHIAGQLQLRGQRRPDQPDTLAFFMRRARLKFDGHAFHPGVLFELQLAFEAGVTELKDLYLELALLPSWLHFRAGQFKRPFSRQFLNSGLNQELVGRAITHNFFATGRDIGLMAHNTEGERFEYALGLFNGTGVDPRLEAEFSVDPTGQDIAIEEASFTNIPRMLHPALVARVAYNMGGIDGYSEADLEGGAPRLALGSSTLLQFDADNDDTSGIQSEIDFAFKAHGFSSNGALYVAFAQDGTSWSAQRYTALGYHLQAGFVFAGWLQPALRFAQIHSREPNARRRELAAAFSTYIFDHQLKWQIELARLTNTADTAETPLQYRLRTHLQLAF